MRFSAPKGAADILPAQSFKWRFIEDSFKQICSLYGYEEIRTPIFEQTELFTRGLGESSDIVSKEMYSLTTKGGDNLTLKPEGTAPVARAFVERHLGAPGTITKLYYITPIFRYERPQAGRYRQSHQIGLEAIGSPDPLADAEVIALTMQFYKQIGITQMQLKLNSVGTPESRSRYRDALLEYAEPFFSSFPTEYTDRLRKNPMRLLDSKDEEIKKVMEKAPDIIDYLDDESRIHFEKLQEYLSEINIEFERDKFLVRGLDYYTKTAFEVVSGSLGAQNSLCGGGRYDGLIEECGGAPTPGVGVAMGIERALLVLEAQNVEVVNPRTAAAFIIAMENERKDAFALIESLRENGITSEIDLLSRSMNSQMRQANAAGAKFAIIFREEDWVIKKIQLRNMETKEQQEVNLDEVVQTLIRELIR